MKHRMAQNHVTLNLLALGLILSTLKKMMVNSVLRQKVIVLVNVLMSLLVEEDGLVIPNQVLDPHFVQPVFRGKFVEV